jgi:hypothetical protein
MPSTRPISMTRPGDAPRGREHERDRVLGDGERVDTGRVADGHAAPARRREVDVVDASAPHGDHLEVRAAGEDGVGEACVRTDVDGDVRAVDTADELGFLVGAAGGEEPDVADRAALRVRRRAFEDGGKVVGDGDDGCGHGWAQAANARCAAATPAPGSDA